jgi:hypothetical protein
MRDDLKAWSTVAAVRRVGNAEGQNDIHDNLILWSLNAAGGSIWQAMG